jgi:hypothetical protein
MQKHMLEAYEFHYLLLMEYQTRPQNIQSLVYS